ncbi:hypothetical protein [Salegentibacter agarivorans]|uniref:Lipoprotein n=1 Tax=Salegentibacter agarivorans TaxID=345907 RepID=A0A1I2NH01_9FLAO|nr:hypothetical protein [Salegentibacter agarivorans]SFG00967.1 hypothetical protein SAMN04488033_12013 [Salegentibacter agarivorans]
MKELFKFLTGVLLFVSISSCNNNQQGNIEDDEDQDIRIEGHQKQTAGDDAYPENAVGEYLDYISQDRSADYPDPEKALKLLAAAISEKNEVAGISSGNELQKLTNINETKDYNINKSDFVTILNSFEDSSNSGSFEGEIDTKELEKTVKEIRINNDETSNDNIRIFFKQSGELLQNMDVKGN